MRIHRLWIIVSVVVFPLVPTASALGAETTPDPLSSWNDGPAKKALVHFVRDATDKTSPRQIPPAERIAVFDNDGTLWTEHPMYFQLAFALDRVKEVAPKHLE